MPLSEKQIERHHERTRAIVSAIEPTTVRTLRPDEPMPQHLDTGFEKLPVMNEFVWVAEKNGKMTGILMVAPCHGIIFIVRLRTEFGAPPTTVHHLFRQCMRDCLERGYKGYFTYVDPSREAERKFISICQRAGGMLIEPLQVGLVGNLEQAARF